METPGHGRAILSSAVSVSICYTGCWCSWATRRDTFTHIRCKHSEHKFVWATVVMASIWNFLFQLSWHHLSALGGSAKVAPDCDGNVCPAVHMSPCSGTTQACPGGVRLDLRELESHRRYCRDSQSRIMGCQRRWAVLSWQLEPLRRIQQNAASIFKFVLLWTRNID